MQALYDLIHNLAREEKRLYQLHKRESSFQHIYDGYVKAARFEKALDQKLYKEHFSDVSRAFYSMQKRALMDDILAVLLEHSNHADPVYQYNRQYTRARVLLERQMGDAALSYIQEAFNTAQTVEQPARLTEAVRTQRQALVLSSQPSLKAYEELTKLEEQLLKQYRQERTLERARHLLRLLSINADGDTEDIIHDKAKAAMQPVYELKLSATEPDLYIKQLWLELAFHGLVGEEVNLQRRLGELQKKLQADRATWSEAQYYELLRIVLRNGLKAGDFLLLSGLVYKLPQSFDGLSEAIRKDFLPDYYEYAGLFNFYEQDPTEALRASTAFFDLEHAPMHQMRRNVYYRLAMLLAAHLPQQALEEIGHWQQQLSQLQDEPLMWLLEVMALVDLERELHEVSFVIDRYRNTLKRERRGKAVYDALGQIEDFVEKGRFKPKGIRLFPEAWEEILHADLWLKSKAENSFYYNLLRDAWQQRRQVF